MNDDGIYRKKAVESFYDRDEFQQAVRIISPKSWIYLIIFLLLFIGGLIWLAFGKITTLVQGQGMIFAQNAEIIELMSPISNGYVKQLLVGSGEKVAKGQALAELVPSKKMEIETVRSPIDGIIANIEVKQGELINEKQTLANIMTYSNDLEVIAFFNEDISKKITVGMPAKIFPKHIDSLEYGAIVGKVISVSVLAISPQSLLSLVENQTLVDKFVRNGPIFKVKIELTRSPNTATGYLWTTSEGPAEKLSVGSIVDVGVVIKTQRPLGVILNLTQSTKNWVLNKNEQ